MESLCKVTRAKDVTDEYREAAKGDAWTEWNSDEHPHDPPESGKFLYDYSASFEEKVLVLEGRATLTPTDGSASVSIGAGDAVSFMKGYKCHWQIDEAPVKKVRHITIRFSSFSYYRICIKYLHLKEN